MFEIYTLFFLIPLAISSLALAVLHWFPWQGGAQALPRTAAYSLGTSVVVGVPVTAMVLAVLLGLELGTLFWAALLVVNTGTAGATVHVAYWIDARRPLSLEDVHESARD